MTPGRILHRLAISICSKKSIEVFVERRLPISARVDYCSSDHATNSGACSGIHCNLARPRIDRRANISRQLFVADVARRVPDAGNVRSHHPANWDGRIVGSGWDHLEHVGAAPGVDRDQTPVGSDPFVDYWSILGRTHLDCASSVAAHLRHSACDCEPDWHETNPARLAAAARVDCSDNDHECRTKVLRYRWRPSD